MEFKGTKSEWYINRFGNVVTDNEEVAYMPSLTSESHKIANATLIAAAKDLLEACISAERHHQGEHSEIGHKLRAAINKALTIK
jgi:hypothetical protein